LRPRILFLVPADYDALRRKGVDRMILERDEGGFFERVITVHPLAQAQQVIDLDPTHRIYEFPLGRALRAGVLGRAAAPVRLLATIRGVIRIARTERIDLVRANDPYLMGLIGWRVARALDVPFCISLHADYARNFHLSPKKGFPRLLRKMSVVLPPLVLPHAGLVMPISEHLMAGMRRAGGPRVAVRVIPHGIDMTPFRLPLAPDARALFQIPPDAPVISWVSRMSGENYTDDVAEIVARVARHRPQVVFVLAGDGPYKERLTRRLLGEERLGESVRILPFQSYDRVVAIRRMSTASLCLIGGFSLIEACAAGSPIVGYDVDWHREIVADGVSGFLAKEHDVDAVVAALERLVDDPSLAATMGREAQRVAFARHDLRITSEIKQACYMELLGWRRAAS
jgi:glycosyltransferase involved in cell wall biosynthesis